MVTTSNIALGYAIIRGVQLAALTVPWLLHKLRRADVPESERALVLMIGSRSILLGLVILALGITNRRAPLGWVVAGDALLQLFDALQAVAMRRRKLAILPAILCVFDAVAAAVLIA